LVAAKRILRYLKGTLDWCITYSKIPPAEGKNQLLGYADASYASDLNDRRFYSGHCFLFNNCLISWQSQKQKSVTVSTTEAEYKALTDASRQLIWLKRALLNLPIITFP
jgi:hypothetical protein